MSIEQLSKEEKKMLQDRLRSNQSAREAYASALSEHITRIMGYIEQEAYRSAQEHNSRLKLREYIDECGEELKKELKELLTLTAGDDIIISRKSYKPDRFEILDLWNTKLEIK